MIVLDEMSAIISVDAGSLRQPLAPALTLGPKLQPRTSYGSSFLVES